MASLPTDARIRSRAFELGFVSSTTAPLPNSVRRRVAKLLQDEAFAAANQPAPSSGPTLLSRFTYETPAGLIQVDVTLHQKEGPSHG